MVNGPVFDFHHGVADLYVVTLRESVCDLTADHALDDPCLRDLLILGVHCLDRGTVSYDRDLVCYI